MLIQALRLFRTVEKYEALQLAAGNVRLVKCGQAVTEIVALETCTVLAS